MTCPAKNVEAARKEGTHSHLPKYMTRNLTRRVSLFLSGQTASLSESEEESCLVGGDPGGTSVVGKGKTEPAALPDPEDVSFVHGARLLDADKFFSPMRTAPSRTRRRISEEDASGRQALRTSSKERSRVGKVIMGTSSGVARWENIVRNHSSSWRAVSVP